MPVYSATETLSNTARTQLVVRGSQHEINEGVIIFKLANNEVVQLTWLR
jgi:hypothetical protein